MPRPRSGNAPGHGPPRRACAAGTPRLGGPPHVGLQALRRQLGLPLRQCRLLGDHFLRRAGLGERTGLSRASPGLLHLCLEAGVLDSGIAFVLCLQRCRLLLALERLLVGLGGRDACLARDSRGVRRRDVVDVAAPVSDLLDLHRVEDQAELLHLRMAALGDLLGQPVAFANDLLDGQRTDDRAQVPGEHPSDQLFHLVLLGQEPARRIGDRGLIVTDLECGDRLDVQPDALDRDAILDDLGDPQRQRQCARLAEDRQYKDAPAGDDAERRLGAAPLRPGDQQRLIRRGNMPEQHDPLPLLARPATGTG